MPTPTPDRIESSVNAIARDIGLGGTFLGLTAGNWADLAVAILIIIFGYYIAAPLLIRLLKWIVNRTDTKLDGEFLN